MEPLQQFTQMLMEKGNLDTLPKEAKAKISEELEAQVTRRLGAVIVNALPEVERDSFIAKLNENMSAVDRAAIMDEAARLVPNFKPLLEQALQDVAVEFLSNLRPAA
jgi:hypothetical protein